jgi:hypothetical protein
MKTAIFPDRSFRAVVTRAVRLCAILLAAFGAGSLFAAPVVKTLGGGASSSHYGYKNGETLTAMFHTPMGLTLSQSGDLFVADYGNNAIRELYNFAGTGNGTTLTYVTNKVKSPVGVAVDLQGNLFVLNRGGTDKTSTNGTVIEFNQYSLLIATNATHLTNAVGIALDLADDIYVTERSNLLIKITGNVQTTVATITAPHTLLKGVAVMPNGNLAVCDAGRDGIYTIIPGLTNTIVTTNAGFNGQGDGTGPDNIGIPNSLAKFFQPSGVAAAGDGSLIVSDFGNGRVKVITASGITTNLYGVASNDWAGAYPGWEDGTVVVPDEKGGVAARCPFGVVLSADGSTVYATEDHYHLVRQVTDAGFVATPPPSPVAPMGLTASLITNGLGATEVYLTWQASSMSEGVTNYLVERSTSAGGYTILASTTGTTYTDTTGVPGTTYYYVIVAVNAGGASPDSSDVSVYIPIPPPPSPTIGWYDFEGNDLTGFFSVLHPISGVFVTENDLSLAINPNTGGINSGIFTYYVSGLYPLSQSPTNNGSTPPPYVDGLSTVTPLPVTTVTNLQIEAVNQNGVGEYSAIVTVQIIYQCSTPVATGTNAAQFLLSDITTNITYYYTTDGTDPITNAPPSQQVTGTNGFPVQLSINISSNFTLSVRAIRAGYMPSPLYTNEFLAKNFQNNEITWGFASGEASSEFITSPGQWFYAPVTLITLPGTVIYSMQFNMVETNLGPDPVLPGDFSFQSMLKKPGTDPLTGTPVLLQIPPYMFIGDDVNPPPPNQIVPYDGTNFVNLAQVDTNLNELAVGWYEMYPQTNLYDTGSQDLIALSQAYVDLYPDAANPQSVIVGAYAIQIPTNAQPGERYQIQLNRPSADSDGLGAGNSAVTINLPTTGSLTNGPVNSIKTVTVGQPRYLAGDVYPFRWLNAGDFGNGDLITYGADDVQDVFDFAIYDLDYPLYDPNSLDSVGGYTNVSDFYDAMDCAGGVGVLDGQTGYWTNNGTLSGSALNPLFNVNDNSTINEMAFGDSKIDVCDVFVTFIRSEFPDVYWFQRFYTNDTAHGIFGRVAQAITVQTNVLSGASMASAGLAVQTALSKGGASQLSLSLANTPVSITNTPTIHFSAGDYLASAGQSLSIPVTATVYGPYPARMLMFNVTVTPLDGSPPLTSEVSFSPIGQFNNSGTYNTLTNFAVGSCAAAFLPMTLPISSNANITGNNLVGYLNLTIPANATSMSAYALSFEHASASPNGLVSFPRTTYTGLITLSSRTNSYYNDGIPDSWRLRYFGTIYNELSVSNANADGTGMDNWQKYLAGLNPENPASVLNEGMDQAVAQSSQDAVIYWPSVNGQTYIIKRSSTLFPPQWVNISTNTGDGTYMEIHDTSGGNNRYYEVTTP